MFLKPLRRVSESVVQFGWWLRCSWQQRGPWTGRRKSRCIISETAPWLLRSSCFFLSRGPTLFFFLPGCTLIFDEIEHPAGVHPVFAEKLTEDSFLSQLVCTHYEESWKGKPTAEVRDEMFQHRAQVKVNTHPHCCDFQSVDRSISQGCSPGNLKLKLSHFFGFSISCIKTDLCSHSCACVCVRVCELLTEFGLLPRTGSTFCMWSEMAKYLWNMESAAKFTESRIPAETNMYRKNIYPFVCLNSLSLIPVVFTSMSLYGWAGGEVRWMFLLFVAGAGGEGAHVVDCSTC